MNNYTRWNANNTVRTRKRRVYVTGPAKINRAQITLSYIFANIFSSESGIPLPSISEESPLNSAVVTEILLCLYEQFISYDRAKTKKSAIFCTHMVDFRRLGHILQFFDKIPNRDSKTHCRAWCHSCD